MMLLDMTVKDFLTALKSDAPAPGGGSAAALVGGVAAALALMVGNLTADNEKYQTVRVEVQSLRPQLDERLTKLERFIDEDTAIMVSNKGEVKVIGNGAVYILDGSNISYSNVSEQHPDEILSIFDVKMHVLRRGDRFDLNLRLPFKETTI